jgi:hypothetical protein
MSLKQRAYASELDGLPSPECRLRLTFDKSRVRERRTPGPVRGARGNSRLYPDHTRASAHLSRSSRPLISSEVGMVRPNALAGLRLMTSSRPGAPGGCRR